MTVKSDSIMDGLSKSAGDSITSSVLEEISALDFVTLTSENARKP